MTDNTTPDKKLGKAMRVLLIAIILACAGTIAAYWLFHRPRAERKPPQASAILVETAELHAAAHQVLVKAMGTVMPSQSVNLAARISGEIVSMQPELLPGGRFRTGEEILLIDPTDYELAVRQRRSDVAQAEYALKVEMGKQSVARSEYKLLGETIRQENEELVLREPQLKAGKAALDSALAALQQAELDLARTRIVSPFNSLVQERQVGLGSQISAGSNLVTLIDTDQYWVEVSIPADRLDWINIPGTNSRQGSAVRITQLTGWGGDAFRTGAVKSLMAGVDQQSRMARLLVEVKDPLCLQPDNKGKPQLTINTFVQVEIQGKTLPSAFRIPRSALHEGGLVWLMTEQHTLDIRPVKIAWDENEYVFVKNSLHDGDRLITTSLAAPVQGMALRTATDDKAEQR
ncbi:MAG: efflux RND transporter periplasmic adaptor subunit [Proteobacteria bacterium]|nr:efflux RND transporter periplasmic adaptor subunit [Pseudomonadota bacterium]MBU4295073.1 efflux RND transporter periplasmic adaptor subunit [Pseudomonadota bacterium]MCG2748064.1 efflux RND transporter periplasmic adaptor subunit [Desulfobulbaceae bacterium]